MSEHYVECRALPTINETFPQFSSRAAQATNQPQLASSSNAQPTALHRHRNSLILSPLDLSLRAGVNIVPITPPSTPSPPRKRSRFMSDEHYLWRPHVMGTPTTTTATSNETMATAAIATITPEQQLQHQQHQHSYLHPMTYARREDLNSAYNTMNVVVEVENYNHTTLTATQDFINENNREAINNFGEIPKSQRSVNPYQITGYQRRTPPPQPTTHLQVQTAQSAERQRQQQLQHRGLSTIYMDNETIVLTEDEDENNDEIAGDVDGNGDGEADDEADEDGEDEEGDGNEFDEENETLVSSQELNEDDETNQPSPLTLTKSPAKSPCHHTQMENATQVEQEEEEDEEFVDIVGNDDDDEVINPLSGRAITLLQTQTDLDLELEKSGKVLTRNKLIYENEELHNRAVDGLAKLFDRDFQRRQDETSSLSGDNFDRGIKTYIDLTNCHKMPTTVHQQQHPQQQQHVLPDKEQQQFMISSQLNTNTNTNNTHTRPYKTHKTERKRMKLRKHMALDEETISPVSGTIIRKLRDDEELVVRKGDIDPAFNVVEVTEEAKAILASIDNKIGAYLCQLCRTLYDDAFKLAQHRCPRIVHIEYKCSECEKVSNIFCDKKKKIFIRLKLNNNSGPRSFIN